MKRHELVVVGGLAFARVMLRGRARLLRVDLDTRELGPAPTRELVSAARLSIPAHFDGRVVVVADHELLSFDLAGQLTGRAALCLPAPLLRVHAWLTAEVALVGLRDGSDQIAPLLGGPGVALRPGFFGAALAGLRPRVEVSGQQIVWAQSREHLTIIDLVPRVRAQIVGGIERLSRASPTPVAGLWLGADGTRAASLGVDGSLERFDLDAARTLAQGWVHGRVCASAPSLERFVVLRGGEARWVEVSAEAPPRASDEVGAQTGARLDDGRLLVVAGDPPEVSLFELAKLD